MQRRAGNDWRTNVAQGGTPLRIDLSSQEAELAIHAAEAVGCPVAGVDLLPGRDGKLFVIEVNAVPGWRALGDVCQLDVAGLIVRFLAEEYSK
jgi:glutathione synthase/RimK-type ligase-like ATP-grasp enzyme